MAAPNIVSPVGGHVYNDTVAVPVGRWSLDDKGTSAEIARSDLAAIQRRVFVGNPDWSFSLPLDASDSAIAAGFVKGTILSNLAFKLGAGTNCHLVQDTTVESVATEYDAAGQPIGVTVRGGGGTVTLDTALPA